MTNGEKIKEIFPNIIKYGNILIDDTGALQKNILFDDTNGIINENATLLQQINDLQITNSQINERDAIVQ